MNNAEKQLNQANRARVAARIEQLEANTDAEVVCAVATESGRYDRAESICGLFFGLLALISANNIYALDDWDVATALPVGLQVLLVVAGFFAGALLAGYWHGLRRIVVSQDEIESEVGKCVHQVFSQHVVGGTRHRGGLLIYVSLFEHRLEIHCDSALHSKLAPADLDTIRGAVFGQVRAGKLAGREPAKVAAARVVCPGVSGADFTRAKPSWPSSACDPPVRSEPAPAGRLLL